MTGVSAMSPFVSFLRRLVSETATCNLSMLAVYAPNTATSSAVDGGPMRSILVAVVLLAAAACGSAARGRCDPCPGAPRKILTRLCGPAPFHPCEPGEREVGTAFACTCIAGHDVGGFLTSDAALCGLYR